MASQIFTNRELELFKDGLKLAFQEIVAVRVAEDEHPTLSHRDLAELDDKGDELMGLVTKIEHIQAIMQYGFSVSN